VGKIRTEGEQTASSSSEEQSVGSLLIRNTQQPTSLIKMTYASTLPVWPAVVDREGEAPKLRLEQSCLFANKWLRQKRKNLKYCKYPMKELDIETLIDESSHIILMPILICNSSVGLSGTINCGG
jgi:hypothetical protein